MTAKQTHEAVANLFIETEPIQLSGDKATLGRICVGDLRDGEAFNRLVKIYTAMADVLKSAKGRTIKNVSYDNSITEENPYGFIGSYILELEPQSTPETISK